MITCVFCDRIKHGEYDAAGPTGTVVRFEPLHPVVPGHMLFVSREHVADASEHPQLAGRAFAHAAAHGFVQAEAFNLITSAGSAATQTIGHLHVHYVPRHADDGLALPWTDQVVPQ